MHLVLATVDRDGLDWALTAFTVIGVIVALFESWRSGRMARVAQHAVRQTEAQLAANHLISLAAQLEGLEAELGTATTAEDKDRALLLLIRWRASANEAVGLIETQLDADHDLLAGLKRVATFAMQAHTALSDSRTGVKGQTKQVRQEIAEALGLLSRYAGSIKSSGGRPSNGK